MNFAETDLVGRHLEFQAPRHVKAAVDSLGRTEDVRFSPSNRRLGIVDHFADRIFVFDVSVDSRSRSIALTTVAEVSSAHLKRPHGIDFIDDKKIVVANREGRACVFELPLGVSGKCDLEPIVTFDSREISSPGSVAVSKNGQGLYEVLLCNDYKNVVTRHSLDLGERISVRSDAILLKKWILFPDGICVSKDGQWIAVSNHDTHAVFVYKNDRSLNTSSTPNAVLRHYYPHGVRFASHNRLLLATSAGSPYLNIYHAPDSDWRGVRDPAVTIRVLSNEEYLRCRVSREDGGPKGIDINNAMNLMVMSCENRPLAFFDFESLVQDARLQNNVVARTPQKNSRFLGDRAALQIRYQLYLGRVTADFTAGVRWVLTKVPLLSRILNTGRKFWNPLFLTRPY